MLRSLIQCLAVFALAACGGQADDAASNGTSAALSSALTGFALVDTDTHAAVSGFDPIADGATISLAAVGKNLAIRALSAGTPGSVVFALDAGYAHTENAAPYSLCGDDGGDFAQLPCTNLGVGAHALSATAYSGTNGSGTALGSISVHFTIVASGSGSSGSSPFTGFTLVNTDTHTAVGGFNPIPSNGTINLATIGTSHISIEAEVGASVAINHVIFTLDGSYSHQENTAPYSLCGDEGASLSEDVCANLVAGSHTLSVTAYTATGAAIGSSSVSFQIVGGTGGGGTTPSGSGTCSPTAAGPGGAGSANVPGSQVPAFPKLTNAYTVTGLDASGGTDSTAIIQAALNAHAQIIIPGSGKFGAPARYAVKSTINVPTGAIIECETGAEFLETVACTGSMPAMFQFSGTASVTGAGIYGCMFKGTASAINVPTSYNHSFIRLQSASNYTVVGNYTTNSCGDADIRLDGPGNSATNHGSTGNLVAFNDTEHAENGIAIINAWNNTVKCNTAFDGGLVDEEPNSPIKQCGDNLITKNYEKLNDPFPGKYRAGFSVGGNETNCPPGSGICALDTVTDNVLDSGNTGTPITVWCECASSGQACDNAKFGGTWSGNVVIGGSHCGCGGSSCSQ